MSDLAVTSLQASLDQLYWRISDVLADARGRVYRRAVNTYLD